MKTLKITFLLLLFTAIGFSQIQPTQIVGGDKDKHGCIASAGYTYSIIKKKCIRIFEEKIQLKEVNPTGTSTSNAAVVFDKNKKRAEIFTPNLGQTILTRTGKKGNYVWKKGAITLTYHKGYVLKNDGKVIFSQN